MLKKYRSEVSILRRKAEELFKKKPPKAVSQLTEAKTLKLIHELEVHQIELEMQNDELILAKEQAEAVSDKYIELYDFAPSGYFTLSKESEIIEINFSGANMLGKERSRLKNSLFGFFVSDDSKPIFSLFLGKVFKSKAKESCKVTLYTKDKVPVYVHLTGIVTDNEKQCLVTAMDISERKRTQELLQESKSKYQAIFESTGTATMIVEDDTTIHMANKECYSVTGYTPAELIGQKWIQYLAPESLPLMRKNQQLRLYNPDLAPKKYQVKLVNKKGEIRDAVLNLGPIPGTSQVIVSMLDITEQKQAEMALKESETHFRTMVETLPVAIYMSEGVEQKAKYMNSLFNKLFGYSLDDIPTVEQWWPLAYPDETYRKQISEEWNKKVKQAIENQLPIDPMETVVTCKDGSKKNIMWQYITMEEMNYACGLDLTKRKQAEKLLKESAELFSKIFMNSPIAISLARSIDGKYTQVNDVWCKLLGFSREDALGKNAEELKIVSSEDRNKIREEFFRKGKLHLHDSEATVKSGEKKNILSSVEFITIHDAQYILSMYIDITERKQAEEEIKNLARFPFENTNPILRIDSDGVIQYANPASAPILAMWERQAGQTVPDDWKEQVALALSNSSNLEIEVRCNNRDFSFNLAPIAEENYVNVYGRDITESKQAEIEIKRKNEQLVILNAEKDKFFSIIAHDLRGPISTFLGLTHVMAEEYPVLTPDKIQKYAVNLRDLATSLFSLLENLLQWAGMQQGLISFHPEVVPLIPIVKESIAIVMESANKKEIEIAYDIPENLKVIADINILQTVIRNLVSNAVKFSPRGGKIHLSAATTGDNSLEISIKDTGIGMSRALVKNLFRLDTQENRKGTEGEPSTGLGLLLCKELVEKHGGKIWVESKKGKGSNFKFTLANKAKSRITHLKQ